MLPKTNRLQKEKDIEKVFKEGKGSKEDFLVLKVIKNNLKNPRFGFIVSKKVSNKATIRNRIKRQLRSLIQENLKSVNPGQDILILALPGLENKDFWEIEEVINKLLKKARIIQ